MVSNAVIPFLAIAAIFSLVTPVSASRILIAQGGCDTDDPSCSQPPATSILAATLIDDTITATSSYEGLDSATWLTPYGGRGDFLAAESGSNQVHSLTLSEDDGSFKHNFNFTVGSGPVFLSLIPGGPYCASANYDSGSFSIMNLLTKGVSTYFHKGSGPDAVRQSAPHVHSVYASSLAPGSSLVYALDLGVDKVVWYVLPVSEQLRKKESD
ncbi:hypothetical protein TrRE_jg12893 [Triparma retinervis]|uniref:Uncharacterized protein n=1 Tax=Triparma retinervis TaxID=2557542 RepID=A0A9W6ZP62_9STRA|nr:hypothetical protein TrRE_jg12893 [Triparma retinervis]